VTRQATTRRRLLNVLLGDKGLDTFVSERRQRGMAWRIIAREIYEHTGEDITGQTLSQWYPEDDQRAS